MNDESRALFLERT